MLLALLAVSAPAHAASLTVDPSDSTAYSTIQDAIDAAASGDTISVVAGTFTECIDTSGKSLTIQGAGSSATTLDGASACTNAVTIAGGETVSLSELAIDNAYYRAIYVDSSVLTVDGLELSGLGYRDYVNGAGIQASASTVMVSNTSFSSNQGGYGAAIMATDGAAVTVSDSTFDSGYATGDGGAVFVHMGSVYLSEGNTYTSNHSYHSGGAIFVTGAGSAVFVDADVFDGNWGYYTHGTAIMATSSATLDAVDASFSNHSAYYWWHGYSGTIYGDSADEISLRDVVFVDNLSYHGADVAVRSGDLSIDGMESSGGYANYGGSVFLANSVAADIADLTVVDAESYYNGGAIYAATYVDLTLSSASFTDSVSTAGYGGDLFHSDYGSLEIDGLSSDGAFAYYNGGSLFLQKLYGVATIYDATITSAESFRGHGGGLYAYHSTDVELSSSTVSSSTAYYNGGGVYSHYYSSLVVEDSELSSNISQNGSGGGLYFYPYAGGIDDLSVGGSRLESNTARYHGGGLYSQAANAVSIDDTELIQNAANGGSGGHDGGGAHFSTARSLSFTNNHVCGNTAYEGAGVYSYNVYGSSAGSDSWKNNVFQENAANHAGGAVFFNRHYYNELVNNTFVGNLAGSYGGTIYGYYLYTDFLNNLVAYTSLGDGVYGEYYTNYYSSWAHNDWYNNTSSDFDGYLNSASLGSGNLFDDPLLEDYRNDGNCDNDDLRLAAGSTLIDAGDATILDADGSTSDIGAYGGPGSSIFDGDGDGYDNVDDCDDGDSAVNPGALESCNGVDDDCDGELDESGATGETTWYADADSDGYGDSATTLDACDQPSGHVGDATDCDDTDATVNPGAVEVWYDGLDADCAGDSDYDADADGFDSDAHSGTDCDDTDASVYVGAADAWYDGVDSDCAGNSDFDADADGDDAVEHGGGDCDDADPTRASTFAETWYDGLDADCLGDDDFDADGDGHQHDGYGGDDCDDTDPDVFPGQTEEYYDGIDANCDGASDFDADGDGFDSDAHGGADCDDADEAVSPDAVEVWYDGVDGDCDGASDLDADGDGEDSADHGGVDCDDTDPAIYTGATETWYDGVDSDCSGSSDFDADGDGHDSDEHGGADCDDADASVLPGADDAPEDGIDQDCDGEDATSPSSSDGDEDGAGGDSEPAGDAGDGLAGSAADGKGSGCSVLGGADAAGLALIGLLAAGRRRREG